MKKNRFTRAYVVTLIVLIIVLIINQFLTQTSIATSRSDGSTIALAGNQSTLSQQITKSILAIEHANTASKFSSFKKLLSANTKEFIATHKALKAGDPRYNLSPANNSAEIQTKFKEIEPYFQNIVSASNTIINLKFDIPYKERKKIIGLAINSILSNERNFVRLMDAIVDDYQNMTTDHREGSTTFEFIMMGIVLLLILIQGLFIFKPAVNLANRNFLAANTAFQKVKKSEEDIRKSAEKQLEINENLYIAQKDLQENNKKLKDSEQELLKSTQQQIKINEKLIQAQKELSNSKEAVENSLKLQQDANKKLEIARQNAKESELRFRTVVENAPLAIFAVDKTELFTLVEGQGLSNLDQISPKAVGKYLEDFSPIYPEMVKDMRQALNGKEVISEAMFGENAFENHFVPLKDDKGKVLGMIGVSTDVTDRRKAQVELKTAYDKIKAAEKKLQGALKDEKASKEELANTFENLKSTQSQLVQQEKMASLGQLTAGIAHEINNPINFVYNGIDTLKMSMDELLGLLSKYEELEEDDANLDDLVDEIMDEKEDIGYEELVEDIQELVSDIKTGAVRTIEIVKGLRVFSRLDEEERKPAHMNESLDATLILLKNKTKDRISIKKFYDEGMKPINCFPGQLNQVFMNILNNAIQAMPEDKKDPELQLYTELGEENVVIKLKDNGKGMPDKVKERIFEPFFTTKAVGVGTGLGMSISFGIIEKHGGTITVDSEEGVGTEFTITLPKKAPVVEKKEEKEAEVTKEEPSNN